MESLLEWICIESLWRLHEKDEMACLNVQLDGSTAMDNSTCTTTISTIDVDKPEPYSVLEITLIATITTILSLVTIIGNVLVMVSFKMDRRLQTVNNYFLLSLAVADFMIGSVSMPLFTLNTILQGWKLGPIVCDLWLALDYLCSNASVLNLLMISFDRYFSVTNPLRYRARRNSRLAAIMISCAWVISFITWPPWILAWPYIEGKRSVPENECYIQFLETNTYVTIGTAMAAFYVPVIVMCVLYYKIYRETEKRKHYLAELIAENEQSVDTQASTSCPPIEEDKNCTHRVKDFLITLCNVDCDDGGEDDSSSPGATTPSSAETPIQSSRATSVTIRPEQLAHLQALLSQDDDGQPRRVPSREAIYTVMIHLPGPATTEPQPQASVIMIPDDIPLPPPMRPSLSTSALMANSVADHNLKRCSSSDLLSVSKLVGDSKSQGKQGRQQRPYFKKKANKLQEKKHDKKAARTLTFILLAFILTWTPYNVLVLIKSVEDFVSASKIIPQVLWDFSYYLCYMNSMINPLCYALANANFRKTYWRILTCTWGKKSKLSIIRGMHSKAS